MSTRLVPLKARFFKTALGNEPVREWLRDQDAEDKKIIGDDIRTVQYGWPIGMPLVRKMGADLWEVRSDLPDGIARVFFTVIDDVMILLYGIKKKSKKTPKSDLKLAKQRLKLVRGIT